MTSVVPRKVLSTLPADEYVFYENQLAARMVDEAHRYLSERLEELTMISDFEIDLEKGKHQRINRVYSLLAEAVDVNEIHKNTRQTRLVVEKLFQQSLSMFDQILFKAIPPQARAQVLPTVRNTNILVKDRHYRFVNLLWTEWLSRVTQPKTNREIQIELQNLCACFDRYCVLLVCRALDQLKFKSRGTVRLIRGEILTLYSSSDEIKLLWDQSGLVTIFRGENVLVRIVPLIATLTADEDQTRIDNRLEFLFSTVSKSITDHQASIIILYPGYKEERKRLPSPLQYKANTSAEAKLGLLPVSTYELGSLERVARRLRWAIQGSQILAYPPKISIPVKHENDFLADSRWMTEIRSNAGKKIHGNAKVIRNPSRKEIQLHKNKINDLYKSLKRQGKIRGPDAKRLDLHQSNLDAAIGFLESLRICPLCNQEVREENFYISTDDAFSCRCVNSSCQISWGIHICGQCNRRYPFFAYSNPEVVENAEDTEWVDQIYGMDILATPCPIEDGGQKFICPNCGRCPNKKTKQKSICSSCIGIYSRNEAKV
ncbi:hypothetical protein ACFLXI_03470 [Chloroflexota bacterium]